MRNDRGIKMAGNTLEIKKETKPQRSDIIVINKDPRHRICESAAGIEMSFKGLEKAGERIYNLERTLHIRNHHTQNREIEWVCELSENKDKTKLNKDISNKLLDNYYGSRGWNKTNEWAIKNKLKELG